MTQSEEIVAALQELVQQSLTRFPYSDDKISRRG